MLMLDVHMSLIQKNISCQLKLLKQKNCCKICLWMFKKKSCNLNLFIKSKKKLRSAGHMRLMMYFLAQYINI